MLLHGQISWTINKLVYIKTVDNCGCGYTKSSFDCLTQNQTIQQILLQFTMGVFIS